MNPQRDIVVGIDLAGSPGRMTGICAMEGKTILACSYVHTDEEILSFVAAAGPVLITIDAPLTLPPGRKTLEDRNGEHFRPCDRILLRRGIKFFPITLGPMRMLTTRGIALARLLKRRGIPALEMYPGAAQDILNIPRKQHSMVRLRHGLERLGLRGIDASMNGDELDAVTGGYIGVLHLRGLAELIGDERTGGILLPLGLGRNHRRRTSRRRSSKKGQIRT
jgi:hypothetical protein